MKSILLVEDDPFIVDIYNTKLKQAGFDVDIAQDGERAIDKLEEKKPDLVILDIVLPQVDGWEVLRRIKNNPDLKNLKVIVFSNLGQQEEIEKGIKLGSVKYLIKAHYTPSQVVEQIKELLSNKD